MEHSSSRPKLKLCVVAIEFPLLSETFVIDQVKAQALRGFDTSVVADRLHGEGDTTFGLEPLAAAGLRQRWSMRASAVEQVQRLPGPAKRLVSGIADTIFDRRFDEFDVLLAHFGPTGARLARSRGLGRFNRPFATIFHGNDVALPFHSGGLGRYRRLLERGDLLLPVSEYFKNILIDAGATPDRTIVHRTGVDCNSISFQLKARDGGPLNLLSACRLVEKKGIEYALRALADLRLRRPDVTWLYQIIGDGPLLYPLSAMSAQLGLAGHVRFLGPQPHSAVKMAMAQADIFLLPSVTAANGDMEGVPVVIMEAMASGTPVVSTWHSGIPELVQKGITGFLAPERDVDALSRELEQAADNPTHAERMAGAARSAIEADFNQDILNDTLAQLLRKLAGAEFNAR